MTVSLQAESRRRNRRRGCLPDFFESLHEPMRTLRAVEAEQSARVVGVETMNIIALVHHGERIVHALRLRLGFVNADCIGELAQEQHQAWTVPLQVAGIVDDDLNAVAAAREKEVAQQFLPPDAYVAAAELAVEDPEPAPRSAE